MPFCTRALLLLLLLLLLLIIIIMIIMIIKVIILLLHSALWHLAAITLASAPAPQRRHFARHAGHELSPESLGVLSVG